jgi:hypothetical protein
MTYTKDHFNHLQVLQQCFDRMRQYSMKFNIKKCMFFAQTVNYLGFKITKEGISLAKDIVEAIQNFL